jgi:aryl-alcohol dehydrogenase-like predicted oxidoreductase
MEALETLIQKGKIRAGAVCNYPVELLKEAGKTYAVASDQVPYSMVNRAIEKDVVPFCIENNIGILAYSPLQRGLLTGKIRKGHRFNEGDTRPGTVYYQEPNFSVIMDLNEKLANIASERGVTLAQLVLNWTINQPGITCALAGARNPAQVLDNVKAADFKLTDDEIAGINNLLSETELNSEI